MDCRIIAGERDNRYLGRSNRAQRIGAVSGEYGRKLERG
jgi:hypothetical protein